LWNLYLPSHQNFALTKANTDANEFIAYAIEEEDVRSRWPMAGRIVQFEDNTMINCLLLCGNTDWASISWTFNDERL